MLVAKWTHTCGVKCLDNLNKFPHQILPKKNNINMYNFYYICGLRNVCVLLLFNLYRKQPYRKLLTISEIVTYNFKLNKENILLQSINVLLCVLFNKCIKKIITKRSVCGWKGTPIKKSWCGFYQALSGLHCFSHTYISKICAPAATQYNVSCLICTANTRRPYLEVPQKNPEHVQHKSICMLKLDPLSTGQVYCIVMSVFYVWLTDWIHHTNRFI